MYRAKEALRSETEQNLGEGRAEYRAFMCLEGAKRLKVQRSL